MKIFMVAVFSYESTNVSQADGFRKMGLEVIEYNYRQRAQELGYLKIRDEEIVTKVEEIKPDFVFFSKCNQVHYEVVRRCNRIAKTILWYQDPPGDNMDFELIMKAHLCDFVFAAAWEPYVQLKKYNKNTFLISEGFDHLVSEPISIPKEFDVSFIGSLKFNRGEYCKAFGAKIFSSAYGLEHTKVVCQSRINLNFTANAGGTSDRAYKIMASKGFLLTEPWPMMEKDFTVGKDLVIMNSVEEGLKIIRYYLDHESERETIAQTGYDTVQKFSRINFAANILDIIRKKL